MENNTEKITQCPEQVELKIHRNTMVMPIKSPALTLISLLFYQGIFLQKIAASYIPYLSWLLTKQLYH